MTNAPNRRRTVILAAGDFPRKGGAAWRLLSEAARVVACDSAAVAYRRRFRRWPTVIVGDLDSLPASVAARLASRADRSGTELVRVSEQDTNDLEKALALCSARGWAHPLVVGATGKREDHAIGNVFRALAYGAEIVTDRGRFVPVCGRATLCVARDAPLSVFAPDPRTRMTSRGLAWPLDGVRFRTLSCATLNRTTATRVVLTATRPVSVYLAEEG